MRTRTPGAAVGVDLVTSRRSGVLQIGFGAVIVLASAVELVRIATGQLPLTGLVALVVAVVGCGLGLRLPMAGLVLIAAAPLVDAALGVGSLVPWNIVVFAALVLTLRGAPGLLTAALTGIANLVAVTWTTGAFPHVELMAPVIAVAAVAAVAAAATGSSIRGRDLYLTELRRRAEDAVTTREIAIDRGVAQERLRIARDLHDSVGQRIAVLSMRIGSAEVHLPSDATEARADLVGARAEIRTVLAEVQQILRVLRIGAGNEMDPIPQHGRIAELVDSFRSTGLEVDAAVAELPADLPPPISAALYRITQEMLTNASRHGSGSVSLRLEMNGEDVVLESANPLPPAAAAVGDSPGTGYGLIGIRERAESCGGTLELRSDDRLFLVRAQLPATGKGRR